MPILGPLTTVGMFAGVGGIELGLARAGHRGELLVEIEPGARAVLARRFPDANLHDDVCTLRSLPKQTDLLVGGFPCQDLSQAGQTRGIEGSRSGLVGEVFRLLRRKRVPWVLLENVPFMLQLSKGRAMEVVVATFESLGYKALTSVDFKARYARPQPINSFQSWIQETRPKYYSFWAFRVADDTDFQKVGQIMNALKTYCNGVGAFFYRGVSASAPTTYVAAPAPELTIDSVLNEMAFAIVQEQAPAE